MPSRSSFHTTSINLKGVDLDFNREILKLVYRAENLEADS